MSDSNKISDLIDSREKWGRTVLTLLLLGGAALTGLYFWGQILPWLLDLAENTTKLLLYCALPVVVATLFMNERLRNLMVYMASSGTRWITSQFISIDPIGILKTRISRLGARLTEMVEIIGGLKGQRVHIAKLVQKKEEARIENLQRANQARKIVQEGGDQAFQMKGQFTLSSRQAGRLKKSNVKLTDLLARLDKLIAGLERFYEASSVTKQDIENEVEVQTEEWEAIKATFKGFKRGMQIMATDGPERELFDETMNRLADNCADMLGKMDQYMDVSKGVLNGMDLDNMMFDEAAMKDLEDWENKQVAGSTGAPPPLAVRVNPSPNMRVPEEASPDSFGSLFENNNDKSGQGKA